MAMDDLQKHGFGIGSTTDQKVEEDHDTPSMHLAYSASESSGEGGTGYMTDVVGLTMNGDEQCFNGYMTDVSPGLPDDVEMENGYVTDVCQTFSDQDNSAGYLTDVNDVPKEYNISSLGYMTDVNNMENGALEEYNISSLGCMTDVNNMVNGALEGMCDVQICGDDAFVACPQMNCSGYLCQKHFEDDSPCAEHSLSLNKAVKARTCLICGICGGPSKDKECEKKHNRMMNKGSHKKKHVRFSQPQDSSSDDNERVADSGGEDTLTGNLLKHGQTRRRSRIYPLHQLKNIKCCSEKCINMLTNAFSEARNKFTSKDLREQADWLKSYLGDHHVKENGKFFYNFFIGVSKVCRTAWLHVNGVTRSRFYELKKAFEAGRILTLPRNHQKVATHDDKVNKAMVWLCHYASEFGDKMPDSKYTNLPSSLTKNDIFERMSDEILEQGDEPCTRNSFFKTWKKEFPHFVIPKQNRFSKCNSCIKYKLKLESICNKEQRKKVQTKRDNHIKFQNAERRKYYKHIFKAKKYPQKYMSLIIDGMDQIKTSIPRPRLLSKYASAMWKLSCHVVAVIVHGRGHHVYVDVGEIPQDSNSTCNILVQTFLKHVDQLPPILYVQMDNTVRENKNQFVFALFCVLVELKIFEKVKVSFLPVGHTHEDVDQYFSRISIHLAKFAVATFSRLLALIPSAVPKYSCTAERLRNVFNYREWFLPCLTPMQNHSIPHVFKFTRDKDTGKAVIATRNWASTGEEWKHCASEDSDKYLLKKHPDTSPDPVLPDLEPLMLNKLMRDIKAAVKKELMTQESLAEWENFVQQLQEEENTNDVGPFPLYDLIPYENQAQDKQHDQNTTAQECESSDSEPSAQIHLGRRRKSTPSKPLEVGDMVCVYDHKFTNEWPQVGEVTDLSNTSLTVKWYGQDKDGGAFDPMFVTKGRKKVAYTHTMPMSCVITDPFKLNKNRKLPKKIQDVLHEKFHDYFSNNLNE